VSIELKGIYAPVNKALFSASYFTNLVAYYSSREGYRKFFKKCDMVFVMDSCSIIHPAKNFSFGNSILDVFNTGNLSSYQVKYLPHLNVKILLSKVLINGFSAKTDFHFYKDKLFKVNYTFDDKCMTQFDIIISSIINNYSCFKNVRVDKKLIVNDENERILLIDKGKKLQLTFTELINPFYNSEELKGNQKQKLNTII
jgi:hypothetical protein